jgi:hypothetical protein
VNFGVFLLAVLLDEDDFGVFMVKGGDGEEGEME